MRASRPRRRSRGGVVTAAASRLVSGLRAAGRRRISPSAWRRRGPCSSSSWRVPLVDSRPRRGRWCRFRAHRRGRGPGASVALGTRLTSCSRNQPGACSSSALRVPPSVGVVSRSEMQTACQCSSWAPGRLARPTASQSKRESRFLRGRAACAKLAVGGEYARSILVGIESPFTPDEIRSTDCMVSRRPRTWLLTSNQARPARRRVERGLGRELRIWHGLCLSAPGGELMTTKTKIRTGSAGRY